MSNPLSWPIRSNANLPAQRGFGQIFRWLEPYRWPGVEPGQVKTSLACFVVALGLCAARSTSAGTVVSIVGGEFHLNGPPTYAGRVWRGHSIQGLMLTRGSSAFTAGFANARREQPDGSSSRGTGR